MHLKRNVMPIWLLMVRHVDAVCFRFSSQSQEAGSCFTEQQVRRNANWHCPDLCSLSSLAVPPRFLSCAGTPEDAAPELGGHMQSGNQVEAAAPPTLDMFSDLNMKSSPCQLSELLFVTLKN